MCKFTPFVGGGLVLTSRRLLQYPTNKEFSMSHLVVLGLKNCDDAERVFDLTGELAQQRLLQLQDAAYAYKDGKDKVRIQQALNLTTARATDIAAGAGVAPETVYSTFRNKPTRLKTLADVRAAGNDQPIPVAQREPFQRILTERDPRRKLQLYAAVA